MLWGIITFFFFFFFKDKNNQLREKQTVCLGQEGLINFSILCSDPETLLMSQI